MNIIFLGPQTSGKGTQAKFLSEKLGMSVITTGEILRKRKATGDEEGNIIASFINAGELVPDEMIDRIVRQEFESGRHKDGVILDGYPRNLHQAEELDKFLSVDKVVFLDVPDGMVVKRMSARRVCDKCGENFNLISRLPKEDGICDVCSGKLVQREDDTEQAIAVRLNNYHNITEPLIEHYEKSGKLIRIDGTGTIEEVRREIMEHVAYNT